MARSKDVIKSQIITEINGQPALAALNSTSAVALWKLFVDVVATALNISEQLWDAFKVGLEKIAAEAVAGTAGWLQKQVLAFQFGDQIQVNPNFTVSYPVVDTSKCIITRCSVKQLPQSRQVLVKVAKGNVYNLQPLSQVEMDALNSYISKVQFAGTYVTAISLPADRLVANIDVYFDAEYTASAVKANVIDAINDFIKNLEFDGVMYLIKLQDAIQKVPGVIDVVMSSLIARSYSTAINDPSLRPINRIYETDAGYLVIEDAPGYTLNDTINLIPQ